MVRSLKVAIVIALIVAFAVVIGYAIWIYVVPLWAPIVVYGYLALGGIVVGASTLFFRGNVNRHKTPFDEAVASAREAMSARLGWSPSAVIKKVRTVVDVAGEVILSILLWPVMFGMGLFMHKRLSGLTPMQSV